jgi:hypothetical protein
MQYETCRHVKEDGVFCGSPAIRDRQYCYYHLTHRGRRLRRALALSRREPCLLDLPPLEDLRSMRVALSEVVQAVAHGQLDYRAAGVMLYGIQQATTLTLRINQQQALLAENAASAEASASANGSATDDQRITEYPEFERRHGLQPGIDLDAATDQAMRGAEEQAAILSVGPTPLLNSPFPTKAAYTRDESYQMMQYEIQSLRKEVREYREERDAFIQRIRKQPASATPLPEPAASTA